MTIVFDFPGRFQHFPLRHRRPPYCPVLFVLPRLTRILSLLCVIVYSQHAIPRPPHSYRRLPETKKKLDKKTVHRDASDASLLIVPHRSSLLCVTRPVDQNFNHYQLRSRTYKLVHAMAPRRVNNRNLRVIPFSQALLLFQINLAPCPTTPPPLPPTITPLRLTATDKEVPAYATLVGPSNSPQSNHSVSVVDVYVTLLPFCPCDPEH